MLTVFSRLLLFKGEKTAAAATFPVSAPESSPLVQQRVALSPLKMNRSATVMLEKVSRAVWVICFFYAMHFVFSNIGRLLYDPLMAAPWQTA